jgi:hypothetical protein
MVAAYDLPTSTTEVSPTLSPGERIARWERRTLPIIAAAAILPMVQLFQDRPERITTVMDTVAWLIFAYDLAVHI